MYLAKNKVRMHDTDMAGRLYFARQFRFAHDALEDLVEHEGFEFDYLFHKEDFVIVIVHCEADYYKPLKVGDLLATRLTVERAGTTSFTLLYQFYKEEGEELVGTARTVHVTLDKKSGEKIEIPGRFRKILEKYTIH